MAAKLTNGTVLGNLTISLRYDKVFCSASDSWISGRLFFLDAKSVIIFCYR